MTTSASVHTYDPKAVATYEFSLAGGENTLFFSQENPFVSMAMLSSPVKFPLPLFMDSSIELY